MHPQKNSLIRPIRGRIGIDLALKMENSTKNLDKHHLNIHFYI